MSRLLACLLVSAMLLFPVAAHGEVAKELRLDLNALQTVAGACRVTFLATNDLGAVLDKSTFELAIFGKDGAIARVVALDFKGLTVGKTKIVQFDLKDIDCPTISRVLVNDVTACEGKGVDPAACLAALRTTTATGVVFGL